MCVAVCLCSCVGCIMCDVNFVKVFSSLISCHSGGLCFVNVTFPSLVFVCRECEGSSRYDCKMLSWEQTGMHNGWLRCAVSRTCAKPQLCWNRSLKCISSFQIWSFKSQRNKCICLPIHWNNRKQSIKETLEGSIIRHKLSLC